MKKYYNTLKRGYLGVWYRKTRNVPEIRVNKDLKNLFGGQISGFSYNWT